MASDLVQRRVSVIIANTNAAALAAKIATTDIPVVFYIGSDLVQLGLVSSLNRSEGNLTGRKRVVLLHRAIPTASKLAVRCGFPTLRSQGRCHQSAEKGPT